MVSVLLLDIATLFAHDKRMKGFKPKLIIKCAFIFMLYMLGILLYFASFCI